jgi:hypothetical protein
MRYLKKHICYDPTLKVTKAEIGSKSAATRSKHKAEIELLWLEIGQQRF